MTTYYPLDKSYEIPIDPESMKSELTDDQMNKVVMANRELAIAFHTIHDKYNMDPKEAWDFFHLFVLAFEMNYIQGRKEWVEKHLPQNKRKAAEDVAVALDGDGNILNSN